ncbi:MAG: hypothetical protein ABIH37_00800 [archaeon]
MKKKALISLSIVVLLNILVISAIELDITEKPISNAYILEFNQHASYELTIRNLGETDTFEIYSLVGIDINPKEFIINSGESKKIIIELTPQEPLKKHRDTPFRFEYKIKNSKNEIQTGNLLLNIINLESAFSVQTESINPNSETITLIIKNNLIHDFQDVEFKITSAFFEHQEKLAINSEEEIEIKIPLNIQEVKKHDAGNYLVNSQVTINKKTSNIESQMKFLEQEGIETLDSEEGFFIRRTEIFRKNIGNIKKSLNINLRKNLISSIFTYSNIAPTNTKITGFSKIYTWNKELIPNEEIKIITRTNWYIPIVIIIIIIIVIFLIRRVIYSNIELTKKVSFVKTKGGQFALKITLKAKAKDFVERIKIIDKLPSLVKLYEKFGVIEPDKIDLDNKRLVWNIESLNKGETRIFTYIIYSKIGVVGRFELPEAKAIYEKEGKVKETTSNRSFYINEPRSE